MTIVDNYFPFDGTGPGATATAARWRLMARLWSGSGVVPLFLNSLRPSIAGSVVTIATGAVWIDGYYGEIDAPKSVSVSGNGMVVARMDPAARQIALYFVANQTVPVQNLTGNYEIPLMQVTGSTGKDIRQFAAPIGTPVHARAFRAGVWSSATTTYTFGFDSISYGSGFTVGAAAFFTCPINGDYLVTAHAGYIAAAVGQWYNLFLCKNGSQVAWSNNHAALVGQYLTVNPTDIIPCTVGDQLSLQHSSSQNGNQGLVGSYMSYMTVRYLP